MSEENPKLNIYCKFCEKNCDQEFIGQNKEKAFTLTFYCKDCGSFQIFEFFGSQFEQPTELD